MSSHVTTDNVYDEKRLATSKAMMTAGEANDTKDAGMSSSTTSSAPHQPPTCCDSDTAGLKNLPWLDRLLALWILLAIILGIVLGNFVPGMSAALQRGHLASVSAPIAAGLLVMMYPILCRVRFEALHLVFADRRVWIQLGFSVLVNWIFAPLLMLGLAWAFLPDAPGLRSGLILVGLARCIAMVLVWTQLAGGDTEYCAVLVAINSLLQLALFAPLAVLFVRIIAPSSSHASIDLEYGPTAESVAIFLGIPLAAAVLTRLAIRPRLPVFYDKKLMPILAPLSLLALLYTVIVLFAAQGRQVAHQVVSVVRVAAPLVVYFAIVFGLAILVTRRLRFGYRLSAAQSFTAASNNFELAIAVATAIYGPNSDEALAATVGPLIEVPVLVTLVYVVRWGYSRGWWGEEEERVDTEKSATV